ncbi:hypothetical protein CsatA_026368 [Cannabis sativa]
MNLMPLLQGSNNLLSNLEEERLGFFVLQLSAPKDNRWCFVLSYSDDRNFECLGLLRLIILCSWKSIGGAIDSFTITTFDANHCPDEPGKQVKSAVRLRNTSKYHVAFKLISPASIVAKINGQDSICKADLEEVTSLYHDRCIIMKKGGLMGKVASDKCHKWVFKEPTECEPNISNYRQSSFDVQYLVLTPIIDVIDCSCPLNGLISLSQGFRSLSGGQKSRVVFTSISMSKPHILLLDEPTNHLDMQSIDALADALDEFTGGVVLVSHDSRLISRVCEDEEKSEIWVVEDGTVRNFPGTFKEYKEDLQREIKAEVDD